MSRRDGLAADPKNLRMVESIARRIHARLPSCFDLGDLIGAGNMGLLKAAERYAPAQHGNTPFPMFARQVIRGAILDTCTRNKYIEKSRSSIDDPGRLEHVSDWEYYDDQVMPEALRGFYRIATIPGWEEAIDRSRVSQRLLDVTASLPPDERKLIRIWYGDDEPGRRLVARRMKLTVVATQALHDRAIANLQASLQDAA
jgi:RNA polymerase sigma factor (sigma-70 family)